MREKLRLLYRDNPFRLLPIEMGTNQAPKTCSTSFKFPARLLIDHLYLSPTKLSKRHSLLWKKYSAELSTG
jgi:hypothetical protein